MQAQIAQWLGMLRMALAGDTCLRLSIELEIGPAPKVEQEKPKEKADAD